MNTDTAKPTQREYVQAASALTILGVGIVVGVMLLDVRKSLDKHNDLISQQMSVTRSMHHVQELATAYLEGRKAAQAAEDTGIPADPVEPNRPRERFTITPVDE